MLYLDPDPVKLYRSKTEIGVCFLYNYQLKAINIVLLKYIPLFQHELNNRKATIVSSISKIVKSIIMIIQAFKSTEILNIFNDLKSIEKRLNIRGKINNLIKNVIFSINFQTILLSL